MTLFQKKVIALAHNYSMKKLFILFIIYSLSGYQSIFAVATGCPLDTTSDSPIQKYAQNIDALLKALEKVSQGVSCQANLEVESIPSLLNELKSVGFDTKSLLSDIRFYFDPSDVMLLPAAKTHQEVILEIQQKILKSALSIGGKCAQTIIISEDISLSGATYSTKNKYIRDILIDSYSQTKSLFIFFRNITTNIADREYADEKFRIAPKGFSDDMRQYYSAQNIQLCLDQNDKNKSIKKGIQESSRVAVKYKQKWEVWRDKFHSLLFDTDEPSWNTQNQTTDTNSSEPKTQADLWGLGNSKVLIDRRLFEETKELGVLVQTIFEYFNTYSLRAAYQLPGALFIRQVTDDVREENEGASSTVLLEFLTSDDDATSLAVLDRKLYDDYALRKQLIFQNKVQDPRTTVGLIRAIEQLEIARPIIERIAKKICDVYDRQATNVSERPTCQELFNG